MYNLGSGTTNDGNTARAFFRDPKKTAEITGLNENLITRFSYILKTISCGYEVNADQFDEYAKQTAKLFVDLYPWFYMPSSVHKVLIHGGDIIRAALLPIGSNIVIALIDYTYVLCLYIILL